MWEIRKDGVLKAKTKTENDAFIKLHRLQGQSNWHAMKYEGWTISEGKKVASEE